ncbi:DUF2059 domain-containing protein [Falsirhodobacter deserti]|uniref:DUF2059 domain-containing protein n=1 Tax=Falsirhodobacter deserti TaxID=1365611 RepID=UPI000FE38D77|nr:DUF2059 domain-containing protein [Falsirhodobacter deserti]
MLRTILTAIALWAFCAPIAARAQEAELERALRIREIIDVMVEEGVTDGQILRADMFPDASAGRWTRILKQVYDDDRMHGIFSEAFQADLSASGGATAGMTEFFTSDIGQKVIQAEIAARRALMDDAAEDQARLAVEKARDAGDPRLDMLRDYAETNALVEMNVAGGLNASLAFFRGMRDAGALGDSITEQDMLRDVWAQEGVIRSETEAWLYPYLLMAYQDLKADDLARYIEFSASRDGQILNNALFAGFDAVFVEVSYRLGLAAGRQLQGLDI